MAKKRANGEGSIRKRADGRWEGRYTAGYHPETGKRIIKNVLGKTQAECKAKLKKAIEESQALDISRANEYTVATWLRTWFGNVKKCAVGKYPKSEKLGSAGQAACCACAHSRYLTGGSPSGLRV